MLVLNDYLNFSPVKYLEVNLRVDQPDLLGKFCGGICQVTGWNEAAHLILTLPQVL